MLRANAIKNLAAKERKAKAKTTITTGIGKEMGINRYV